MKTTIIEGDLLETEAEVIVHQVNCMGKMGSGVAKAIRDKWPIVYEKYHELFYQDFFVVKLGICQPVKVSDTQRVINMFSEENYGYDGKMYTSYDAVNECFGKIRKYMESNGLKTMAIPYKMSCVRGGANWDAIMALLNANFGDSDISIEIRKLDRG